MTAAVVGGDVLGIAARIPRAIDYQNPLGTVYEAVVALWGYPKHRDYGRYRWDLDHGSFEAESRGDGPRFSWRTSALLAMPEQDRPILTLDKEIKRRREDRMLDKLVGLFATDPLWPQAVERASQLVLEDRKRPWQTLTWVAITVLNIAKANDRNPDEVTLEQVRAHLKH